MKILLTGANGYLGQGITKALLDNDNEVIATDFRTINVDKRATAIPANLFEIANPYEFFLSPESVLHLAWRDGFLHNSHNHLIDLPQHYAFLEKLIKSGVRDITVMGSMHEIGFFEGRINDDTPCHPMNLYGIAKNALRDAVKVLCKTNDASLKWLRGYYIVGNPKYGSSIFSKITAAEHEGKHEFPFTTGQNQYDFLDYDLFCKYVALATAQNNVLGIINICSGKPEKLADRVEKFINENGYNIKLKYGAFPDRPYDSKAVWGDNSKIHSITKKE